MIKEFKCLNCGKIFSSKKQNAKYCSRRCAWDNNGKWQQRRECWYINSRGYLEGRCLVDGQWKCKKYHRRVMELLIGRELLPNEDVHHINGDKLDNRIENLMLLAHGEHSALSNVSRLHPTGYHSQLSNEERKRRSEWMKLVHEVKSLNHGVFSRNIADGLLAKARGEEK